MKRLIAAMLVIAMCLSLCACGKSEAVRNVEALIDAIGTVDAGSGPRIAQAEEAYLALPSEEREQVEDPGRIEEAKIACAQALIDAIGTVTLESEGAITAAKEYFDGLSAQEQTRVTNAALLTQAQAALEELQWQAHLAQLTDHRWIQVNDCDSYRFTNQGEGSHDGYSLTYTLEGDELVILEGTSLQETRLRWDNGSQIPRLIPDDGSGYYVREADYAPISSRIRRENIWLLLSWKYWDSANGYITFYDGGTAYLYNYEYNADQDMTWMMTDNNSFKCQFRINDNYMGVMRGDILNEKGDIRFVTENQVVYTPKGERTVSFVEEPEEVVSFEASYGYTVCLRADGTAQAVGYNKGGQCNISSWRDLIDISTDNGHTLGLKSDGTVIAAGETDQGRADVSGWTGIIDVDAGYFHSVGLKADGTVLWAGYRSEESVGNVNTWRDIVAISAGGYHTLGLKADGTVVAAGYDGEHGRCQVSGWTDIIAISAGGYHSVGLRADGTVVAVGNNGNKQCEVSGWTDIIAISAGDSHTVGLKADGTVVATGANGYSQCNVTDWRDIVAISAGGAHTVGLRLDGTFVVVGNNEYNQCAILLW